MNKYKSTLLFFSLLGIGVGLLSSCGSKQSRLAKDFIEDNVKNGSVSFVTASDVDSTNKITQQRMLSLQKEFSKTGNMTNPQFAKPSPNKTFYYVNLIYTVTDDAGKRDSFFQTVYTDKDAEQVYCVKNRNRVYN